MHESLFSYNLSRPYPFKWFTPVVLIGGVLITVAVSFLSIGTSGYQLISVSSSDPNATEAGKTWFGQGLGSIIGSMQPSCAPTTIPLDTVLYTNNTALQYTLKGVSTIDASDGRAAQGSLVYHNNALHNCTVTSVQIVFEGLERSAVNIARQQQGAELTAYVGCTVETPQGRMEVNMTATYNYLPDGNTEYTFFHGRNVSTQASLYWAESMLLMYWLQLTNTLYLQNQDEKYRYFKGMANLNRANSGPPTNNTDVKSLDFFSTPSCVFLPFSNTGLESLVAFCDSSPVSALANGPGDSNHPLPAIWIPADSISKTLYYTVLTDLGQVNSPYVNLFTDKQLLEYFTLNFTAINSSIWQGNRHIWGENMDIDKSLAYTPFTEANATIYDLKVNPSTLATNYLCQIPHLKPTGSLIVSVLIADLVLLQVVWRIFKLVTDYWVVKRQPQLKYCEGCLSRRRDLGQRAEVFSYSGMEREVKKPGSYVALLTHEERQQII